MGPLFRTGGWTRKEATNGLRVGLHQPDALSDLTERPTSSSFHFTRIASPLLLARSHTFVCGGVSRSHGASIAWGIHHPGDDTDWGGQHRAQVPDQAARVTDSKARAYQLRSDNPNIEGGLLSRLSQRWIGVRVSGGNSFLLDGW